jgi:hypothetical protein
VTLAEKEKGQSGTKEKCIYRGKRYRDIGIFNIKVLARGIKEDSETGYVNRVREKREESRQKEREREIRERRGRVNKREMDNNNYFTKEI